MTEKTKKLMIVDDSTGDIRMVSYGDAVVKFLDAKMVWMTSREISDEMKIKYTTLHPKLNNLAKEGKILTKTARKPKVGRRPKLWGSVKLKQRR